MNDVACTQKSYRYFDYRNYNQHISTGSLLIEVGSHANSLDEAVYSGELLGDCMADALLKLSE